MMTGSLARRRQCRCSAPSISRQCLYRRWQSPVPSRLISRVVDEAPTTAPSLSKIGDTEQTRRLNRRDQLFVVSYCQADDAVCRVVHLRDGCLMVVNGVVDNEAKGRQYREKNQREQSVPEALTYGFLYKHRKKTQS